MKKKLNTKTLVMSAMLIALQIIFVRLISIGTVTIRVSLGFFPIAVAGMVFGPLGGGIVGALADVMGMILFSKGDVYFFPLTISEFLYGFGFGIMLYNKDSSYLKVTIYTILQFVIINLFINSIWLYFYSLIIVGNPKGYWVIFSGRLLTAAINLPMQVIGVNLICRYLKKPLQKLLWKKV